MWSLIMLFGITGAWATTNRVPFVSPPTHLADAIAELAWALTTMAGIALGACQFADRRRRRRELLDLEKKGVDSECGEQESGEGDLSKS